MAQAQVDSPTTTGSTTTERVYQVVSHTHWDREWFLPFEQMRLRLVELMDNVLAILAREPEYRFHLDAQTVVIEDYLAVRPRRRALLEQYIGAGRLIVGPWYVQNDFYLTSGEATLRNLLIGTRIANELGHCARVGYAPDQFGLIGQLPQILNGFGIESCIFGRGNIPRPSPDPATTPQDGQAGDIEFNWRAGADSRVFALHLPCWYNNAQRFSADPTRAAEYLRLIEQGLEPFAHTPYRLLMNGVDHLEAQENLLPILRQLNRQLEGARIEQATMEEHLQALRQALGTRRLHEHEGELRSGDDPHILQNTASSRVYLKQNNVRLQNDLELGLEPLYVLLEQCGAAPWPADELDHIWRELLKTHPHDNICGCSCDAVHRSMEDLQARLGQMIDWLRERGLKQLVDRLDREAMQPDDLLLLLVNPLPVERERVVEVSFDFPADQQWPAFEVLDPAGQRVPCEVLGLSRQRHGTVSPINLPGQLTVTSARLLLRLRALPAHGWTVLRIRRAEAGPGHSLEMTPASPAVSASAAPPLAQSPALPLTMANEFLRVTVRPDGRIDLEDLQHHQTYADLLGFIDEADIGNAYLFQAAPGGIPKRIEEAPLRVRQTNNSLRQSIELDYALRLPIGFDRLESGGTGQRKQELASNPLTLTLQLDAGSPRLEVHLDLDHRACDHRLRLLLRTGIAANTCWVNAPFEYVERDPGALGKAPRREFSEPNSGLIYLGQGPRTLAVLNEGLAEYEHLDTKTGDLALTLVRATPIICDNAFADPTDGEHLFPSHEYVIPDNQCLRPLHYRLALQPGLALTDAGPALQDFQVPPLCFEDAADERLFMGGRPCVQDSTVSEIFYRAPAAEERRLPLHASRLSLRARHTVLSASKQAEAGGLWVVRLSNPAPQPDAIELHLPQPPREAWHLRLDETPHGPLEVKGHGLRLTLRAREIITLGLRF